MGNSGLALNIRYVLALVLLGFFSGNGALAASTNDEIPMAARMVLTRAETLMDHKDYAQAINVLTTFQSRSPAPPAGQPDPKGAHHPLVYFYLGNCYLLHGNAAKAQAALTQAATRAPDMAAAWQNLAKAHYEQAHYAEAARCFEAAYERSDQSNAEALGFSALSAHMAGQHAAAIRAFQRLFDHHPKAVTLTWKANFAQALLESDQPRRALPLLRDLATRSPMENRAKWQEILLFQYIQLNMHEKAQALAKRLAYSQCTTAKWWKALAQVQLAAGHEQQALVALTIYSYLTPLSTEEKKLLADLSLQLDLPRPAIRGYLDLMNAHPEASVLRNLIIACQRLEEYETALGYLNRFAANTRSTDLLMLKADLLYALKRFGDAESVYHRIARQNGPHAARAWLMAGYAAWQHNDLEFGKTAFKVAAKNSRHRKAAQLALRQMMEKGNAR
ncbi:hypothetical protein JCM12296A_19830 [Desulfosarcina cetonica]